MPPTEDEDRLSDVPPSITRPADDVIVTALSYVFTLYIVPTDRAVTAIRSIIRQLEPMTPGQVLTYDQAWQTFQTELEPIADALQTFFRPAFESAWFSVLLMLSTPLAPDRPISCSSVSQAALARFERRVQSHSSGQSTLDYLAHVVGCRMIEQLRAPEITRLSLPSMRRLALKQIRQLDRPASSTLRRYLDTVLTNLWEDLLQAIAVDNLRSS